VHIYVPRMVVYDYHMIPRSLFGIPRQTADAFFKDLQREAFEQSEELLEKVQAAAQRLWTSEKIME
jgi:hypothetical protein